MLEPWGRQRAADPDRPGYGTGTLFRRFCMCSPRRSPNRTALQYGYRSWASIWWPFVTPSVGFAGRSPGARIEGRTCGSGATRSVDVITTAGSSTWAGSAWKSPRWPANHGLPARAGITAYPTREW